MEEGVEDRTASARVLQPLAHRRRSRGAWELGAGGMTADHVARARALGRRRGLGRGRLLEGTLPPSRIGHWSSVIEICGPRGAFQRGVGTMVLTVPIGILLGVEDVEDVGKREVLAAAGRG